MPLPPRGTGRRCATGHRRCKDGRLYERRDCCPVQVLGGHHRAQVAPYPPGLGTGDCLMSVKAPKDGRQQLLVLLAEIDAACDSFEVELRSNQRPLIEAYCSAASEQARPELARELL